MNKLKTLWQIFLAFFKVGTFTFGGGLAMLPMIQKEVVDNRHWASQEEMVDIFAISQSVPGVISVNSAIFIGRKVSGSAGAFAAALGVILPAFISIILVLTLLFSFKDSPYTQKVFSAIRAASAGLIFLAAINLARSAVKGKSGYIIAAAAFISIVFFNISAAWPIIFGGIAGYLIFLYERRQGNA